MARFVNKPDKHGSNKVSNSENATAVAKWPLRSCSPIKPFINKRTVFLRGESRMIPCVHEKDDARA